MAPKREPYALTTNSCCHFMKGVVEAAGVSLPSMWDPRPVSYIDEIRDMYDDLDDLPWPNTLTVENFP